MKKSIVLLLCLALLFQVLALTACDPQNTTDTQNESSNPSANENDDSEKLGNLAYSDPYTDGLIFETMLDEEGYAVVGYDGASKNVVIPRIYKGFYVVRIAKEAFKGISKLENVSIPETVHKIESYAFSGCSKIQSVTILNSDAEIKEYAFQGCQSLISFYAPNGLNKIEFRVFSECTNLKVFDVPTLNTIGSSAFSGCTALTEITVPDSVTSIGSSAFYNCSGLTSITLPFVGATKDATSYTNFAYIFDGYIPSSLKTVVITGGNSIASSAFNNCSGLTSITITASVTSIGSKAFYNCRGLTSITIPASVTSIGSYAFVNCSNLKEFKYSGTMAQWSAINKESYIFSNKITIYCTDGNVTSK